MAFKQKSSGSSFKMMGSSPAKHVIPQPAVRRVSHNKKYGKGHENHDSPAKQKSKVDRMRKMVIDNENRPEYDAEWEARSDKAKKATKNRSSIQEHQLTLKQLAAQKKKEDATKALSKRVG